MGKVIGIAMLVVAIWAGAEVYTKGTTDAFGGFFTSMGWVEPTAKSGAPSTAGRRIGASVAGAQDEANDRLERMLDE
jgi:hypothetical protein